MRGLKENFDVPFEVIRGIYDRSLLLELDGFQAINMEKRVDMDEIERAISE